MSNVTSTIMIIFVYCNLPRQPITAIPDEQTTCRGLGSPVYLESEMKSKFVMLDPNARTYLLDNQLK